MKPDFSPNGFLYQDNLIMAYEGGSKAHGAKLEGTDDGFAQQAGPNDDFLCKAGSFCAAAKAAQPQWKAWIWGCFAVGVCLLFFLAVNVVTRQPHRFFVPCIPQVDRGAFVQDFRVYGVSVPHSDSNISHVSVVPYRYPTSEHARNAEHRNYSDFVIRSEQNVKIAAVLFEGIWVEFSPYRSLVYLETFNPSDSPAPVFDLDGIRSVVIDFLFVRRRYLGRGEIDLQPRPLTVQYCGSVISGGFCARLGRIGRLFGYGYGVGNQSRLLSHLSGLSRHLSELVTHKFPLTHHLQNLALNGAQTANSDNDSNYANNQQSDIGDIFRTNQSREIAFRFLFGPVALLIGCLLVYNDAGRIGGITWRGWLGGLLIFLGLGCFFLPVYYEAADYPNKEEQTENSHLLVFIDPVEFGAIEGCCKGVRFRETVHFAKLCPVLSAEDVAISYSTIRREVIISIFKMLLIVTSEQSSSHVSQSFNRFCVPASDQCRQTVHIILMNSLRAGIKRKGRMAESS